MMIHWHGPLTEPADYQVDYAVRSAAEQTGLSRIEWLTYRQGISAVTMARIILDGTWPDRLLREQAEVIVGLERAIHHIPAAPLPSPGLAITA
jgi:hypothetical protein